MKDELRDALNEVMLENNELPDPGIMVDGIEPPNIDDRLDRQTDEKEIKDALEEVMKSEGELGSIDVESHAPGLWDYFNAGSQGIAEATLAPVVGVRKAGARSGTWVADKIRQLAGKPPMTEAEFEEQAYDPYSEELKQMWYPGTDLPDTAGVRAAKAGGEFIPETMALMGGTSAFGSLLPKAAGPVTRGLKYLTDAMTTGYKGRPIALTRDMTVGAMGAGAGGSMAREATEDSPWQPVAEMGGAVVGGLTPTAPYDALRTVWKYGPTTQLLKAGARTLGNMATDLVPEAATRSDTWIARKLAGLKVAREASLNKAALPLAAREFQAINSPDAARNFNESLRLREEIPGFNPTLAEATGLPSVAATQASLENSASGNVLDEMVRRKKMSEAAVGDYITSQAPLAPEPENVAPSDALSRRTGNLTNKIDDQIESVAQKRQTLADEFVEANPAQTGGKLRDRLIELREQKKQEMSKLADRLGLNQSGALRVSAKALRKAADSSLPSKYASDISPVLNKLSKLPDGETMTFNDVQYFMQSLGDEARAAARAGRYSDARVISNTRNAIDNYLKDEWAPAMQIGEKYAQFRKTYLDEYIKPFERGYTRDVKALGTDNVYRTDAEDVVSSYFAPGKVTGARDFKTTFGTDPEAMEALTAHIMDDVRNKTVKDGVIDPKKFADWMGKHKDVLQEFPEIQTRLENSRTLARDLADRQMTLQNRKAAVQDAELTKLIGNDEKLIDKVLSNKTTLTRITQHMTNGEKQALARKVWDRANMSGYKDPAEMRKFLDMNKDALDAILTPEHVSALDNIQKALEMNSRTKTPKGVADTANPFEKFTNVTGSTPQQMLSRFFAVKSGRTGWKYTLGDMLARGGMKSSQRTAAEMMNRAVYDADFAKQLAEYVQSGGKLSKDKMQLFKAYMFTSGLNSTISDDQSN